MELTTIATYSFLAFSIIILLYALVILVKIYRDKIDIQGLLSEPQPDGSGKASLSRFQFLIFTFVIAGLYLLMSIKKGEFVPMPYEVLGLLGISGTSYLASKAIETTKKD